MNNFKIKLLERVKTYVTIDDWGVIEAIDLVIEALNTGAGIASRYAAYAAYAASSSDAAAYDAASRYAAAAAYAASSSSDAAAYAADASSDAAAYAAANYDDKMKEHQHQRNDLLDLLSSN